MVSLYDPGEIQVWNWKSNEQIFSFKTKGTSLESFLVLTENSIVIPFFYSSEHPLMINLSDGNFKTFGDIKPENNI